MHIAPMDKISTASPPRKHARPPSGESISNQGSPPGTPSGDRVPARFSGADYRRGGLGFSRTLTAKTQQRMSFEAAAESKANDILRWRVADRPAKHLAHSRPFLQL